MVWSAYVVNRGAYLHHISHWVFAGSKAAVAATFQEKQFQVLAKPPTRPPPVFYPTPFSHIDFDSS